MAATTLCLFGPLTLFVVILNLAAAYQATRTSVAPPGHLAFARDALIALWAAGMLVAVASSQDWQHLFWSAQIPLVGMFLGSGALLCRTWRDDLNGSTQTTGHLWRSVLSNGALLFLLLASTLAITPAVLEILVPRQPASPRATGAPFRALWDLAAWGFGGELPSFLAPAGSGWLGPERLHHPPRDVTVPMGTTLVAAWLWISFSAIAFAARVVHSRRVRQALLLLAPVVVALVVCALDMHSWTSGVLDSGYFSPSGGTRSAIWKADLTTLRSYGPVVLTAIVCAIVLGACIASEHVWARRAARTAG